MEVLIPCNCGQQFPAERCECPYCSAPPKSTWLYVQGEVMRMVEFVQNGTTQYYCGGEILDRKSLVRRGWIPRRRRASFGLFGWRALVHLLHRPARKSTRSSKLSAELWREKIKAECAAAYE